ncbi:glycosyltransferase family 4 protein [Candidatus Chloroploca sp. M-50]|uniref:Glycosyltransferase family 4 protein n=2 Tax=Candidatus Chloroploca mongolica TaxID=2528176 RepID=A0ABS4DE55_9CHLR|nr:glycosyltransferase family 4 protein [Candidatus Chloroploca mongolica]
MESEGMTSAKRVLMIAPTPYFSDRGCHVQIYEVARSQQLQGNHVAIVTYHLGNDPGHIPIYRIPQIPWYHKRSAGPSWHKLYLDLLLLGRTLQIARRYRPHLLHAHLHEGAAIALPVARLLNVPLVLDLQGSMAGEMVNHNFIREGARLYRLAELTERTIIRHVDAMLMWSYIRESLQRRFDFPPDRVFEVDYGVDLERFRPYAKEDLQDLYEELGLPRERQVVVYLGVLSAYQGIDLLLDVIPRILASCPDTHFLLMGYPDEEQYHAQAHALGIADHVTLPGRIAYQQAARYLALGDVAVSAKLTSMEGNGKLLNYMACGLPTVAFDLPGNVATLGEVGCYAPVGDGLALAERIVTLLRDPLERKRRGQELRRRCEDLYSWHAIGAQINAMYDTVLARRGIAISSPSAHSVARDSSSGGWN